MQAAESSGSTGEQVTFWICAFLIVTGGLGLILSRKTVHSALFVAQTMISLAVLYAANGAPFLALVQVIVYTGAVMMLFLFVLMLVGVDSSDSLIETLKGQRVAAILMVLGVVVLIVASVGGALSNSTSLGIAEANEEFGGNVEGLAHLMFTTYLLPLQVVAALLISAALGALVLAHRERIGERLDQTTLANRRVAAFGDGVHPGGLPNPGVLASSNAIGTPALLPDGTPTELSVPVPLRGKKAPEILNDPELIKAEQAEIESISESESAIRDAGLAGIGGHTDLSDVYPDQLDPDEAGTGETELPPAPDDDAKPGDA
ncbi:MAG: NADH-quinone oxidoreductase subunit J [Actinomycetia bacterium]|nr:NADH-quinone oxidoreductase subunit J [Actinomycetes bacterium]